MQNKNIKHNKKSFSISNFSTKIILIKNKKFQTKNLKENEFH